MRESKYAQDTIWVSNYLKGDESGFESLVEQYKGKVYTTIYMIVKDRYIAEDLTQDTFIKALNKLKGGTYNETGKFGPWVTRIAYNLGIDYFRKQKRSPTVLTEDGDHVFHSVGFTEESVESVQVKMDTITRLRQLIERLPETQKEVLKMRHYADMSFQEIAESTGVNINTALGRMRYALQSMRKMMTGKKIMSDAISLYA